MAMELLWSRQNSLKIREQVIRKLLYKNIYFYFGGFIYNYFELKLKMDFHPIE